MPGIENIIRRVRRDLDGELRDRVRQALREQPTEWLVEQLLEHVLPTGVPGQRDAEPPGEQEEREERLKRIRAWRLDKVALKVFLDRYRPMTRERLEAEGHLVDPPPKGTAVIGPDRRSAAAAELLCEAKDLLYALLFGDEESGVRLERVERELLTLTIPSAKAHTVASVLRSATEIGAEGTWRDPHRLADDDHARNTLIQVEYGEVADELVGHGIAACLKLINNLEVNERVLYARMENVEESTLE